MKRTSLCALRVLHVHVCTLPWRRTNLTQFALIFLITIFPTSDINNKKSKA